MSIGRRSTNQRDLVRPVVATNRSKGRRRFGAAALAVGLAGGTVVASLDGVLAAQAGAATTAAATTATATTAGATATPRTRVAATATVDAEILRLQRVVAADPSNGNGWKDLAASYVRRAFESADPSSYPKASASIDRARRLLPHDPAVRVVHANLLLSLHDFAGARREAKAALANHPDDFDAKVALFDATMELGSYSDAARLAEELVGQRPGVASFARLSYLRQLNGDLLGAESAMRAAVSSAPEGSIDRGVALAYLGDVLLERGRAAAAQRAYREARRLHPGSVVAAIGLARVLAGNGDLVAADEVLSALTDRVPVPAAIGLQSEIARVRGDRAAAQADDQLVDASVALLQANGAIVDAELAMLLADRSTADHPAALAAADRAYAARHTIFTADAKAWALYRAGRFLEASTFIRSAIASNPGVASLHWHAAAIFAATGDRAAARRELALANRNPLFSPLQRVELVALARRLGATS